MADFINLAGEAQDFELAKWISTSQIYPTNPLEAMQAYYNTIYDIPIKCQNKLIPNNAIGILDFIELELPKTTSAILTYSAKIWF